MSIVIAEHLSKYYGAQDIFSALAFQVAHGDKIALVGANGVGKTTLLRIIAGLETPSSGRLQVARGIRIGYLSQKADIQSERTLYQEMLEAFAHLRAQQERLRRLEEEMADPDRRAKAMERYGELLHLFELAGGYTFEQEIRRVLMGLGFEEADFEQPIALLSGGQRTRAQLAKLLLSNYNLLLLDEPTNHLDLEATQWLEEYLSQWKGSLIVVAHDRYFLDKVVNRVWEMSFGALEQYPGNYSHYMTLRNERYRQRQAEYEAQREYIARAEEFIRRYKAGQRSREARSREKRLQHLERVEQPRQHKMMKLELTSTVRGGNNVLTLRGLEVGYDRPLIRCPDLLLLRRQRVALLGPNGCGKTTLLKTILGEVPPLAGEVKIGVNVQVAYLAQGHENLCEENTVLEEILRAKDLPVEMARGYLGRFLFSGDDVFKRVAHLSGGERSRVALAMLALQGANFLLLDEPTNQLDIPSQELLEQVLQNFEGTILFVSHDRYFIDAVATQLWIVENGVLRVYTGNYTACLEQLEKEKAKMEATVAAGERKSRSRQVDHELQRAQTLARQREEKRAELEEQIQQLELRLSLLTHELELASRAQRVDRVYDLGREYAELQEELQRRLEEWTKWA
ncbi:MAG: ATP-binding cassette domain-containing protein [Chloroflexi bacterium]|nr:ATP-binding cassette domain-containing protein [Chloroflexota bacterium]